MSAAPSYLDTSVLVAALGNEPSTERAQRWLVAQSPADLFISDWVITEFSSALALKLRIGHLQLEHRAECLAAFATLKERNLNALPVKSAHFRAAAQMTDQYQTGLRAGDALHLAVCADHGARMITLDRTLATAATRFGIPSSAPEPD
ncbi:type II toxin-antitoxin system VapC family toxin [Wenzhouxiangella sp. XN79A]|uniref:type II toxin-antitoxin system VapC family toxin n=1 Tax=Wenzhouxiangella sp. XN79A TaxID=2724193 RepID=UPI00144A866A|nr:type II toxin-antitoxin system VapC family toxin [Wenzhouxiangella sp. XN79A]NKI36418.1 type II toxin-antitoxin system VapC family toxin [Wenzhouxiangella sp. XN79A]